MLSVMCACIGAQCEKRARKRGERLLYTCAYKLRRRKRWPCIADVSQSDLRLDIYDCSKSRDAVRNGMECSAASISRHARTRSCMASSCSLSLPPLPSLCVRSPTQFTFEIHSRLPSAGSVGIIVFKSTPHPCGKRHLLNRLIGAVA